MAEFPRNVGSWVFWEPLADLWLRPWFDRLALNAITRWYMPLSRAWAAALAADGNPERFSAEIGSARPTRAEVSMAIGFVGRQARAYGTAERQWRNAFFGAKGGSASSRAEILHTRNKAAEAFTLSRGAFLPLVVSRDIPPVKWEIPTREAIALRHGPRLTGEDAAFPAPRIPDIEVSRPVDGDDGVRESWLRFPSPVADIGGTVWAHVYEPTDTAAPPTILFLHGICYEPEFMPEGRDHVSTLASQGFRVIQPEAPWHGRRRLPGFYGGEPVIGRTPAGFIGLFEAWVAEVAVLLAWARSTSRGPVALAGISLGALTAQLAATAARHWPVEMGPDALLLIATSGDIGALMSGSALGNELGLAEQLSARGWTTESVGRWLPLATPSGPPALDAAEIIMVLGKEDQVTPYRGGLELADRWRVPDENRFLWDRGHFSTSLAIGADHGPITRLAEILRRRP